MKETIDKLVAEIDADTRANLEDAGKRTLQLFGAQDSPYLKAVFSKAAAMGVNVRWSSEAPGIYSAGPVVYDRETVQPKEPLIPFGDDDLDGMQCGRSSCTAQAVGLIIERLRPRNPHVCIVGRGHAVKGLAEDLLKKDCTVTICHSKTRNLVDSAHPADVVVNCAPGDPFLDYVTLGNCNLLLDISGGMNKCDLGNHIDYVGLREIGRVNTSILMSRFAAAI